MLTIEHHVDDGEEKDGQVQIPLRDVTLVEARAEEQCSRDEGQEADLDGAEDVQEPSHGKKECEPRRMTDFRLPLLIHQDQQLNPISFIHKQCLQVRPWQNVVVQLVPTGENL